MIWPKLGFDHVGFNAKAKVNDSRVAFWPNMGEDMAVYQE